MVQMPLDVKRQPSHVQGLESSSSNHKTGLALLSVTAVDLSMASIAQAESLQVGETYYNMDAVGAAAGTDPSRLVEQPPAIQVVQAFQDFVTELLLPYLLGLTFVYGVALTFGLVEGPFDSGKR
eukprot:CAMPEP_0179107022 /NCGR_PEP_ID=MMETSP0796-20121207/49792_1 /TAXON_ID=73915 /ORGANISM="Pyrodinium bahamense, Strain pbaha01" /LENGTH=123 /DNA_ID=CAMNT_0020805073 /DNA_START=198 /DNA_END=569 /DNA_ORIENTATION=+